MSLKMPFNLSFDTTLSKRSKIVLISCLLFFLLISSVFVVTKYYKTRFNKTPIYKEFGIRLPKNYAVHGIDVSYYQGVIDWQKVQQMKVNNIKISFALIKATEGQSMVDAQFAQNWQESNKKVIRGAYHYFTVYRDAAIQAENFIRTVKLQKGDLPPVLDIEDAQKMPAQEVRKRIKIWLEMIEIHYNIRPIIYTYHNFYHNYLIKDKFFDKYYIWIAHYDAENPTLANNHKWHFWQHSDRGRVNGIGVPVDFNVFDGSLLDLKKILK